MSWTSSRCWGILHTPTDCPSGSHQFAAGEGAATPFPSQGASRPSLSLCSIDQHQQLPVRLLPAAQHMLRVDPPGGFNCRRHAQCDAAIEQQWTREYPQSQPPFPLSPAPPSPPHRLSQRRALCFLPGCVPGCHLTVHYILAGADSV